MSEDRPKKFDPSKFRFPRPNRPPDEGASEPAMPKNPSPCPLSGGAAAEPPVVPERESARNPLRRYSLRGRANEIEANAAATKPLLGKFVMQGQATMIYADPNTGKTLIAVKECLDAIDAGRIDPNQLYYINADDSSQGLAVKLRLMQDAGAHMLAPGFNGFKTGDLIKLMVEAIENGSARGTCMIIDTLKKFTDLMDKKRTSDFAEVCRQYVMAGGTIVALGHTTKRPKADGTPQYQGTTDIMEDFDAVYVAQPMTSKWIKDRVVKFTRLKSRADSPETVAYAYATDAGISYEEKLASLRPVDPDDLDDYTIQNAKVDTGLLINTTVELIKLGVGSKGKMALAKAVAKECGVSVRAALSTIERHTGNDPDQMHFWSFIRGAAGVQKYELLSLPGQPPEA